MRSLKMALIALMLTGLFATQASARDHAVNGLLIGSAVGGMVGYMVGDDMDRNGDSYGRRHVYNEPAVFIPPPPPPRYYGRDRYRHHYRPVEVCREIVVVRERHGRYRESVRTVCRERGDWRDGGRRHYDRGPDRHDRYGNNDRW